MDITRIMKNVSVKLNYFRTFPVYVAYLFSAQKDKIRKDLQRWEKVTSDRVNPEKSEFLLMNRLLRTQKPFRNLIQMRLKTPPRSLMSIIGWSIARLLWPPLDSLYISTFDIGGGLFIQHGFSTVIDAKKIGENCWINQQVTIGYSGIDHPVIEDDVSIHCGAKVLGKCTMHRNSVAGANAVVVKDVPENAVVGGVPAQIIKFKNK